MTQRILGIDVSKETLDLALLREDQLFHHKVTNTPCGYQALSAWLKRMDVEQVHACLEATGQYGEDVASYLYEHGHAVSVINPARIKYYANSRLRRNKTDKADAELIAQYGQREHPALWSPPPASFKQLQALIRHLDDLIETRQQAVNRLKSGKQIEMVQLSLEKLIACHDQQIKTIKKAIRAHIKAHAELRHRSQLLISIPGIAWLTAARILGEVRDVLEFENIGQLTAYAGLNPRNFLSGTSVHKKARLSKTGNAHLRKALYMPAVVAKRFNPIVAAFCNRLTARGLSPMQAIGAAMRKLLHLIFGVLKNDTAFDPHYLEHQLVFA